MRDLFSPFFFLFLPFSRPLLKDKPRAQERQKKERKIITVCQRPHFSKQHVPARKKRVICQNNSNLKPKWAWCWKKWEQQVWWHRSETFFFLQTHFCLHERKRLLRCRHECTCKLFPVCLLLPHPRLHSLCAPQWWVKTEERESGPEGLQRLFFCFVEDIEKKGPRDEMISWRQIWMNQSCC